MSDFNFLKQESQFKRFKIRSKNGINTANIYQISKTEPTMN